MKDHAAYASRMLRFLGAAIALYIGTQATALVSPYVAIVFASASGFASALLLIASIQGPKEPDA